MSAASRRTLLAGFALAPIGGVANLATASDSAADMLFGDWLAACALVNGDELEDHSDEAMDPYMDRIGDVERAIREQQPSTAAAASIVLVELSYSFHEEHTTTANLGRDGEEARALLAVLGCLRPQLNGVVARVAGDCLTIPTASSGRASWHA